MRLTSLFEKENIFFLKNTEKESSLKELIKALKKAKVISKENTLFEKIMEREKLGSTSIGRSIAIPHCKLKGIKEPIIAIGISKKGIEYNSTDGKPVHLLIFVVSPLDNSTLHLQVLASAAHLAKNISSKISELLLKESKEEVYEFLKSAEYSDN